MVSLRLGLSSKSDKILNKASSRKDWYAPILLGLSLGPVFSSCSPTFSLLIAVILPLNFVEGLVNIIVYSLGLGAVLLLIALLGQAFASKLRLFANPNGAFKKVLGVLFIIIGLMILTGFDKDIEAWLVEIGYTDFATELEYDLLERVD